MPTTTAPLLGTVLTSPSISDVDDIYTIRTRIEGLVARRAAEKMSQQQLDALREIVELQEFYVSKKDYMQVWHLDKRYHETLYEGCGSRPLKQMLTLFHNYIQKARESTVRSGRAENSTHEHREILDAIIARDPDEAERKMSIHVTNARDSFFELI